MLKKIGIEINEDSYKANKKDLELLVSLVSLNTLGHIRSREIEFREAHLKKELPVSILKMDKKQLQKELSIWMQYALYIVEVVEEGVEYFSSMTPEQINESSALILRLMNEFNLDGKFVFVKNDESAK